MLTEQEEVLKSLKKRSKLSVEKNATEVMMSM